MDRPLEGKVVLVTGAGVRLGRALAEAVGRAGATVAVHFHASARGADEAVKAIRADGNKAAAFQADFAKTKDLEALVARVEEELGPIAALVNSAAVFDRARFLDTTDELLDRQWAVNTRGPYLLTREVARRMVARGEGDVLNILDIGGSLNPWRNYSAYAMSKAAMASLTQCLALELAPAIRVNGIAPGAVLPREGMPETEVEEVRARIPAGRFGSPADVVETALFLLSGPRFITGQIIAVDGGRSIGQAAR
ncbi:MAG: SDR family NAD(P)-dependent oxidoreductase [Myxococcaceae bacterium]